LAGAAIAMETCGTHMWHKERKGGMRMPGFKDSSSVELGREGAPGQESYDRPG